MNTIRERLVAALAREASVLDPEDADNLARVILDAVPEMEIDRVMHPAWKHRGGERIWNAYINGGTVLPDAELFDEIAQIVDEQRMSSYHYTHAPDCTKMNRKEPDA